MSTEKLLKTMNIFNQPHRLATELLKNGWYPIRLIGRVEKDPNETIDTFMERALTGRFYEQIKEDYCYKQYPNRQLILEEAFSLFEQQRYTACIPLFLMQIDGIAGECEGIEGMFVGGGKNPNLKFLPYMIKSIIEKDPLIKKTIEFFFGSIIFTPDTVKNLTILDQTKNLNALEVKYLNRHGILHGHKEYLNYGSRINALKTINLLLFVINLVSIIENLSNKKDVNE